MKRALTSKLTAAVCALVLLLGLTPTAWAADGPRKSNNIGNENYSIHAENVKSYLYANEKGGLTRVEYIDSKLVVEEYTSAFQLQSSRTLDTDLPIWGGFFAGAQYNFVITGASNAKTAAAGEGKEVLRVVKYDKSWNRQGAASVYGANTSTPFISGSLRCTESGGILYIHTCHEMFASSDGRNHQANMQLMVRESDMTVTETNASVSGYTGYVSHSFNQFILADQSGNILTADHGDGYPRAMVIHRINGGKGSAKTDSFPGSIGQNQTGAQLGGFAETSSGYVIVYAQDGACKLGYAPKSAFGSGGESSLQTRQVAAFSTADGVSVETPALVSTGLSGGYVIWASSKSVQVTDPVSGWPARARGDNTLHYASYDANGQPGQVKTAPGALSDCQPILYNGKAVWYVTDNSAPTFYTLDASGVTATPANGSAAPSTSTAPSGTSAFRDVSANHWALSAIEDCAGKGIVKGYSDGRFGPDDQVTSAQFITMMARAFYSDELAAVTTPAGQPWYYAAAKVAEESHMSNRVTVDEQPMSRYEMAATLCNVIHYEPVIIMVAATTRSHGNVYDYQAVYDATKEELKAEVPEEHLNDVAWCYTFRALTGMDDGAFHGERTMTRAQACVVIQRMASLMKGQLPG